MMFKSIKLLKNKYNKSLKLKDRSKTRIHPGGVAQWIEHELVNQRVTSWIPSQGTGLGCRPGPQ